MAPLPDDEDWVKRCWTRGGLPPGHHVSGQADTRVGVIGDQEPEGALATLDGLGLLEDN